MANIAIKGHETRGKEVIKILEMIGGDNRDTQCKGTAEDFYYYIDTYGDVNYEDCFIEDEVVFFTLDEFYEKYPYKVGDRVKAWVNGYYGIFTINDIHWDSVVNEVKYKIYDYYYSTMNLQPYKEEKTFPPYMDYDIKTTKEEKIMEEKKTPKTYEEVNRYLLENPIKNAQNLLDIEKCLENDGMKLPENITIYSKGIGSIDFIKWYEKSKYQYPNTISECCAILCPDVEFDKVIHGYNYELLKKFGKLLIYRNAYWKIAGDEMGLDKPWEPDWHTESEIKYVIEVYRDNVRKNSQYYTNTTLAFPTEEMRNIFYENFKDLIEQCKELL